MRVALCYNKKPESSSQSQDESEDESDPPPGRVFPEAYAELDDEHTVKAVAKALSRAHEVQLVEADEKAYSKFLYNRPDIVFNIAEGFNGPHREAFIPSILEFLQIPYTGSDPLTLSICLDKVLTKQLLNYHGIPTPEFASATSIQEIQATVKAWRHYPCIVKPVHEGSSIGVWSSSIAEDPEQLSAQMRKSITLYKQPVLVERLLLGREFTVGVLGNGDQAEILPVVEICFDNLPKTSRPIYSYEAKWIWDTPKNPLNIFKCPAPIDEALYESIRGVALKAYRSLRCRDWARIDIRLDREGRPNILEVNPLPGILPDPEDNSCMPKAARAAGIEYEDLILTVLRIACERYGIKTETPKDGKVSSQNGLNELSRRGV
ncbi:MAG: ATP-grasp domain-containing protein [Candidatus Bathyarchaeia archaeon]